MGYRLWRAVGNLPSMCLPVSAVPFHSRIGEPLPTVLRYQFLGEGRGTWVFIGTLLRIPPRPWWRQDDALATSLPCTCNWPALRASKPGAPISLCRHGQLPKHCNFLLPEEFEESQNQGRCLEISAGGEYSQDCPTTTPKATG